MAQNSFQPLDFDGSLKGFPLRLMNNFKPNKIMFSIKFGRKGSSKRKNVKARNRPDNVNASLRVYYISAGQTSLLQVQWEFYIGTCSMYRIFLTFAKSCNKCPAYQNSIVRKHFTVPFSKYKRLKLKLRVLLPGYSVAMVTYCFTKIIPTCSPVIKQFFDAMIVASIARVVYNDTSKSKSWNVLETVLSHVKF